MTGKRNGLPPAAEQFVKLPRELVSSDAWRSAGINERRFLDFLFREHMSHGGKENGNLKAPQWQLERFGIGARYIDKVIRNVEMFGLVDCHRGGMRVATTYAITWLPMHDGAVPSNRWRGFRNPKLKPLPARKTKNLPLKGKAALPLKGKADGANLPLKGKADGVKILPLKGKVLSRRSYQGGAISSDLESGNGAARAGGWRKPRFEVVP
jgi:hypothetical protein